MQEGRGGRVRRRDGEGEEEDYGEKKKAGEQEDERHTQKEKGVQKGVIWRG